MNLTNKSNLKLTEEELDKVLLSGEHQALRAWVAALPEELPSLEWRSQLNQELLKQSPREWLRSVPEESPSLAWRSELNEKLLAVRPQPKRKPLMLFAIASGFGAAAACAIAIFAISQKSPVSRQAAFAGIPVHNEEAMIAEHVNAVSALDLGTGVALAEKTQSERSIQNYNWSEVDVESL